MTITPSNMLPLGTKAPDFKLLDVITNQVCSLEQLKSPIATVVMFICNHCPFVKHVQAKLVEIAKIYKTKNISFIAISSNDVQAYPDDNPVKMREMAKQHQYSFPYLYDENQSAAHAYHAACTPDFYVFDKDQLLVYRGRMDDSTPGNDSPITGKDLTDALDAILHHTPINPDQKPSVGCNIKWKK